MESKSLLILLIGSLLLTGCSKSSSIDSRKTASTSPHKEISPVSQLTDQDVFGNELTLDITEEDIQNAVEEANGEFFIPMHSPLILVQSGTRAPDVIMQKEMQKYYRVSTFSGIPVTKKKQSTQPASLAKVADTNTVEDFPASKNSVINANYMQALRYIAAKGRQKTIVVYWGEMESGKYNSTTKEMSWKKYSGEDVSDRSLRYLIRFALVDVATGEWTTYSPVNIESTEVLFPRDKKGKADVTEQKIAALKQKTCQMVVEDLVNRYSKN